MTRRRSGASAPMAAPMALAILLVLLAGGVQASRDLQGLGALRDAAAAAANGALQQQQQHRRSLAAANIKVGRDDLAEANGPVAYPLTAVGLLVFGEFKPGAPAPEAYSTPGEMGIKNMVICTGFLVAPDLVMTAAHCLYNVAGEGGQPAGFKYPLGFWPGYARGGGDGSAGASPFGRVGAKWVDVVPEWIEYANKGAYYWRGDLGVVKLERQVGLETGYFGLAVGCDAAAAAAADAAGAGADAGPGSAVPKERAGGPDVSAASQTAAAAVAGFPGEAVTRSRSGSVAFPLMSDRSCRVGGAALCPISGLVSATGLTLQDRMAGMLRHPCDTARGMSGSPLWLQGEETVGGGSPTAARAAALASAEGFGGYRPPPVRSAPAGDGGGGSGFDFNDETAATARGAPAVAVGAVSRGEGDCPWGPDCVNLAAPINARALKLLKQWRARA